MIDKPTDENNDGSAGARSNRGLMMNQDATGNAVASECRG